jgi:hypothetical protein
LSLNISENDLEMEDAIITWIFPQENTMLLVDAYTSDNQITTRTVIIDEKEEKKLDLSTIRAKYRIKDNIDLNFTNNTVTCEIVYPDSVGTRKVMTK